MFKQIIHQPGRELEAQALGENELISYRLDCGNSYIEVANFGASLRKFFYGGIEAVLNYDNPFTPLTEAKNYFGAVLVPFAGRVKIADEIILHSGPAGGARRYWNLLKHDDESFTLGLDIADQEDGFPGNRHFEVEYRLAKPGELEIVMTAESDRETYVNMGFHPYFNLSKYPDIVLQELKLHATEVYLPDGDLLPLFDCPEQCENTLLDFTTKAGRVLHRSLKPARSRACEITDESSRALLSSLQSVAGIDHYFFNRQNLEALVAGKKLELTKLAELFAPDTEAKLEVYADTPGLQVYTAQHCTNVLPGGNPLPLTANRLTTPYCGLALEPQLPPNGPNEAELRALYRLLPAEKSQRKLHFVLTPAEKLSTGPDDNNLGILDDPFDLMN
ncbi:MAG: hypothetical protein Q4P65_01485 [Eubacteriales bacterium]|nr:hypothetical protein [Eubacteriales bacterium]